MKTILVMFTKTVLQTTRHVPRIVCLALLALLALVAPRASAAIAVVDTLPTINTANPANNYSVTFNQAGSGANMLVVNLNYRKSTAETTPVGPTNVSWVTTPDFGATYVTQTLTLAVSKWSCTTQANNRGHQIWYLPNPLPDSAGVLTITYTNSSPATQARQVLTAYTLSGVDTAIAPIVGFSVTNTSTATYTTTNDLGAVPLGGFAVVNSTIDGSTSLPKSHCHHHFYRQPIRRRSYCKHDYSFVCWWNWPQLWCFHLGSGLYSGSQLWQHQLLDRLQFRC